MKYAIGIDGSNLHATSLALRLQVDYKKLLPYFGEGLVRAFYYTAIREAKGPDDNVALIPLVDWLSYNGYSVVTKPTKEFIDNQGRLKIKGNMDIEIAVDALELSPFIDEYILFSGDGDFVSLIEALHRKGVRVTVVSSIVTDPRMCADELRRACDRFIDLSELALELQHVPVKDKRSRYA